MELITTTLRKADAGAKVAELHRHTFELRQLEDEPAAGWWTRRRSLPALNDAPTKPIRAQG